MIIPPWSAKARKPCKVCPYHSDAKGTLLFAFACTVVITSALSFALGERYSNWSQDNQCPSVDAREVESHPNTVFLLVPGLDSEGL